MISVELTWNEVEFAADAGLRRFITPIKQGNRNRYGAQNSWDNDISSCLAELAVAKHTGKYWHAAPAVDTKKITNDVGESLEVRCSRTGKLIIRSGDKDDRMYLLVSWPKWSQEGCTMNIVGGMLAKDAKKRDEWIEAPQNRTPAHFVPASALIPAEELLGEQKI